MATAVVFIVLIASVFGVFYLYFSTRHRERMGLIEKGVDASLFSSTKALFSAKQKVSSFRFALKSGMLIMGTGVGLIISFLLYHWIGPMGYDGIEALYITGVIFVFGGLGLVTGYYMGRKLDKEDSKD
jgi:pilus assembly protein TadC